MLLISYFICYNYCIIAHVAKSDVGSKTLEMIGLECKHLIGTKLTM